MPSCRKSSKMSSLAITMPSLPSVSTIFLFFFFFFHKKICTAIAYGSTITIRNVNCEGYLSANSTKYPGMSDGVVGGSYLRNDNNYWIIMPLNERELENKRVKMIEPGSHFRLLNV